MGIPDHLICLLRNLYAGQEATIRTGHETTDWFQIGKGVCQDTYCHLAYLTYMRSTWHEIMGWMKHKLESRLLRKISITSDYQMAPPYGRKRRGTQEPLDESERVEWKTWLKTQLKKTKIMASGPTTSWQTDEETMETVNKTLFYQAPKSLQMVTAAMKLKDACSLEEKLWPTWTTY